MLYLIMGKHYSYNSMDCDWICRWMIAIGLFVSCTILLSLLLHPTTLLLKPSPSRTITADKSIHTALPAEDIVLSQLDINRQGIDSNRQNRDANRQIVPAQQQGIDRGSESTKPPHRAHIQIIESHAADPPPPAPQRHANTIITDQELHRQQSEELMQLLNKPRPGTEAAVNNQTARDQDDPVLVHDKDKPSSIVDQIDQKLAERAAEQHQRKPNGLNTTDSLTETNRNFA